MDTPQQAPEHPPARIRLPIGLTIFVCCVGAFVGGFFGAMAGGTSAGFISIAGHHTRMPDHRVKSPSSGRADGAAPSHRYKRTTDINVLADIGVIMGVGTGLLAGFLWCKRMHRRVLLSGTSGLLGQGARCGVRVGCLATILLHLTLWVAWNSPDPIMLIIGLLFAVVAGSAAGGICGAICSAVLKQEQTNP